MDIREILCQACITMSMLGITSCSTTSSSTQDASNEVIEIAITSAPQDFKIAESFPKVSFLQLEITDDCIIGDVRKVIDADGTLVVLTKENEVVCFNKDNGRFLRQIGSIGEGPEEFLRTGDVYYDNKEHSINIIDDLRQSIVSYSLDGRYLNRKPLEAPVVWMESAEHGADGYLMICNMLSAGDPPTEYAYTVVAPDNKISELDPFAPVWIKGYSTAFASRPMVANGEGLTFTKFLNDTIFTITDGNVKPKYKLMLQPAMPAKELVAQTGPFGSNELLGMFLSGKYFSGIDKIFETEKYITLVPVFPQTDGILWIDKEAETGIRVPYSNEYNLVADQIIQGSGIAGIVGSNKKELISCFIQQEIKTFQTELAEKTQLNPFNSELRQFFDSADPEGNPCLIIYEHE